MINIVAATADHRPILVHSGAGRRDAGGDERQNPLGSRVSVHCRALRKSAGGQQGSQTRASTCNMCNMCNRHGTVTMPLICITDGMLSYLRAVLLQNGSRFAQGKKSSMSFAQAILANCSRFC